MKILIAGGAGYIGSILIPKLLERGYHVDVLDLLWFGNHLPNGIKIIQKDVLDITEKDLSSYDQVIFLAGLSNDPMAEYSPKKNFISNAASPAYLAYISKLAGVKRYIFGSSCSVYGYTIENLYNEESPAVSNYPYGISKLQGEYGILQLMNHHFSVIILRQGTVSGYSPRMRLDLIVNTMFKTAISENVITVNNPSIWRPILAIRDASSAYIRSVEASPNISGIFNIASGNYTVGEVADYVKDGVEDYLGIKPKILIKNLQDYRNYKVNTEKAERILSFKPQYSVKDIIKDLVEKKNEFDDLDNFNYYNIEVFKKIDK